MLRLRNPGAPPCKRARFQKFSKGPRGKAGYHVPVGDQSRTDTDGRLAARSPANQPSESNNASTALEDSPPHRECDDECHRIVVPPFTGEVTVRTTPKGKGHEKCWPERRSESRKFGVLARMLDTGYEEGDKGTAHDEQCQPEARSWSSHSHRVSTRPRRRRNPVGTSRAHAPNRSGTCQIEE